MIRRALQLPLLLVWAAMLPPSSLSARTFLVDFNSSKGFRGVDPASPDLNGNRWNAIPHPATSSPQLNGLVDTAGVASSIDLGFSTPFGSDSYNGPAGETTVGAPSYALDPAKVSATDIDATALGALGSKEAAFDFITTVAHTPSGQTNAVNDARFAIQGLDPQLSYTLKLFGSRKYEGDSTAIYEAYSDAAFLYLSDAATLDVRDPLNGATHNRNKTATLTDIRPSAAGTIYVRVRGGAGGQAVLNSMQIIEGTRPVDSRGLLYIRIKNPATGREIVSDPDLGPLTRLDPYSNDLRGHWYLMTRADNTLVWIVNRATGEALRAATDAGPVSTALWNPDDPRQTWRVTTANGVSRIQIEGTGATLTVGADGGTPSVAADSPANSSQDWILPGLPRGGLFPWTTYDEDNIGTLGAPAEIVRSAYSAGPVPLAAEAQKRGVILLNGYGTAVTWTATAPADAMTLRYSVADGDAGTLTLNIKRSGQIRETKKVTVTSAQAWVYFDSQGNELQSPGTGRTPAKRYNEARIKLGAPLAAGDTIEFRRDAGDAMTWIDAVEAETSALVPLPDAASYLVATDFGISGNGIANDTTALKNAVAAAAAQGKKLYLPAGAYRLEEEIILPAGFVLQGAGMWNTELVFSRTASTAYAGQALGGIKGTGSSTIVRDLYMKSAQGARSLGYHGLKGSWGTGSLVENVWVDQFETGAWIADFSSDGTIYTDGLVIRNCRLRNTFADGVNYAGGTRNSVVENTHLRGCGDDGLASYASGRTLNKPTTRNIQFRYNTIECVYRAGGIGIFGGEGHRVHHNLIRDQVAGPGLRLNTIFVYLNGTLEGYPFGSQLIQFFDNTLERTGALTVFNEQAGAVELQTWYTDVENIRFTDTSIDTTRYEGIRYSRIGQVSSAGFGNIVFTRTTFSNVPFGTLVTTTASGESSFDTQTSAAGINNQAGTNFTVNGPPPPSPVITSFSPAAAGRGSEVTITGTNLGSAALVQIGAQTASFTVVNDTTVRFTVPPQAVDGRIRLTTTFDQFAESGVLVVPLGNESPVIALVLPGSVSVPSGASLRLAANVSDDGLPAPASLSHSWAVVSAPAGGNVSFDDAGQVTTGATFSAAGNYLLRLTVSDGELQSTADVAVAYGGSATGSGQDVGSVALPGSSSSTGGVWTVQCSGADIWDNADGFHFRHAELSGDGFVQVRLLGQTSTDPWAKAGLMIRDNLDADSAHAMFAGTTGNGLALQNRSTAGALSQHEGLGTYAYPVWLRLVRTGGSITAYRSTNGTSWTQVGTPVSPAMADPVHIGLAVTSHNNGALSTATFDSLQGSGFGVPAPSVSAGSDVTAVFGNSATLSGSASGASSTTWEKISGPGSLTFGSATAPSTAVSASAPGVYRVRLNAGNGIVQTFDDAMVIFTDSNKQAAAITLSGLTATYDGAPHSVTATTVPADLPVIVTYNGSASVPVDAGTYAIAATVNDPSYQGSASGTLTIAKARASVQLANTSTVTVYNGAAKAVTASTVPAGLNVVFTYNSSPAPPINAGSYAVSAAISDKNHEGSAEGSLVIEKAAAAVTLGNLTQTYDGSPKLFSATTVPPGLQVTKSYNGSATPPADAGTYGITAEVSDINHTGSASALMNIGKATATVSATGLSAIYDGSAKLPSIATIPPGLATGLVFAGLSAAPTQIGNYPFTATVQDANYQGTLTGNMVISLYEPSVRGIILVDFGPTATVQPGTNWNNFTNASAGYALTNLLTTNGSQTGFSLSMSTANAMNTDWIPAGLWNSGNASTLGALNAHSAATDGFYVQSGQGKRGVRIAGLGTNRVYHLRIHAARNAAEVRATTYSVRGLATNTAVLTNSGAGIGTGSVDFNNNKVLVFSNVPPDASGGITLEYQCLKGSFGYLNSLSLEEKIPVAAAFGTWATAQGLQAGANGDPWSVQPASGRPNYYHFALDLPAGGAAPSSRNQKQGLIQIGGTNYFSVVLPVRRGTVFTGSPPSSALRDGVCYRVEGLTDMTAGTTSGVVEIPAPDISGLPTPSDHNADGQADYEYRGFRFTEPASSMRSGFMRIRVWPAPY